VPWLPSVPTAKKSLDLVPVHCAMSAPVVMLREEMCIEDMRQILRRTRHNGFPVVRDTAAGQVRSCALPITTHLVQDRMVWQGSTCNVKVIHRARIHQGCPHMHCIDCGRAES